MNQTSGPYGLLPSYTYATLPAANTVPVGYKVRAADLGVNGTELVSNGVRWLVAGGMAMLKGLGAPVTGIVNAETNVLQTLLPVGSWQVNDALRIWITPTKSGGTDTGLMTVRIGAAGTTADTAITGLSAYQNLGATGLAGGGVFDIKLISATSAQRLGASTNSFATYQGINSTVASAAATAITDASANALYVSVNIYSGGATNTVGATSAQIQLITP